MVKSSDVLCLEGEVEMKRAIIFDASTLEQKIYKLQEINDIRIFPGDPLGLPDDFFKNSSLIIGEIL